MEGQFGPIIKLILAGWAKISLKLRKKPHFAP
jgi:hypothetical protein